MIESAHDFDFFNQTLFSILFAVGTLFWKCFHRILLFILDFLHEINRGEVSFPNFLDGFKGLMEAFLVEVKSQNISPLLAIGIREL